MGHVGPVRRPRCWGSRQTTRRGSPRSSASEVARSDSASTFASFQRRAPSAVCASPHSAARTPATLFAAIDAPVPGPAAHHRLVGAALGHVAGRRLAGPSPVVALLLAQGPVQQRRPRGREPAESSTTASATPTRSSAATAILTPRAPPRRRRARRSSPGTARCRRSSPESSGWNAMTRRLPSRAATGWPSTSARISTPGPCSAIHGARMNTARTGPPSRSAKSRSASKERTWRPKALRSARDVHDAEMLAVDHDQARARPEHRRPGGGERAQRVAEPLALDPERHRRRLAARDDQAVEPLEVGGHADLAHVGAEALQHPAVRLEVALEREHPDERARHGYQPRCARSWSGSSLRASRLDIAAPSPALACATRSGSW